MAKTEYGQVRENIKAAFWEELETLEGVLGPLGYKVTDVPLMIIARRVLAKTNGALILTPYALLMDYHRKRGKGIPKSYQEEE